MPSELYFAGLRFIPLDPDGAKFFGFSEFIAGLALMVLVWAIADVRYRFRVQTTPIPLQGLTFAVTAAVGALTLLTDLWRVQGWLVPAGHLLTPACWQALLAGLFLLTVLTWTWFAFIRPPTFGKRNAKRYAKNLSRFILKGDPIELAVIADELTYSARALVRHATDRGELKNYRHEREEGERRPAPSEVEAYANDLLLLIADKRLCRIIVGSSPATALAIFQEIGETKKYGIQVEIFAKNIVNEALTNKDSFLYNEAEGYESGLIGYHKPLSHAMFANFQMVETIGTLLDPDIIGHSKWDAVKWEAYCRATLITFRDYVDKQFWNHSYTLYRANSYIKEAAFDLYKLNGATNIAWDDDGLSRLRVVVTFIKDAIGILDKKGIPDHLQLRIREQSGGNKNFYDYLAELTFETIFAASAVKSPIDLCWSVQRNSVWGKLFNFSHLDSSAGRVVKFKVRRLLYNEVIEMNRFPNFKGAKILGFCLNVMGLKLMDRGYDKDSRALHKAILAWTKKHYDWLHGFNQEVAEACLVDGLAYDARNRRIVKTYPARGLQRKAQQVHLEVDAAPPPTEANEG